MVRDFADKLFDELKTQWDATSKGGPSQEFRRTLQNIFGRLDLVTREEFDAQAAVLARTRQKLEELERQLEQLQKSQPEQQNTPLLPG